MLWVMGGEIQRGKVHNCSEKSSGRVHEKCSSFGDEWPRVQGSVHHHMQIHNAIGGNIQLDNNENMGNTTDIHSNIMDQLK